MWVLHYKVDAYEHELAAAGLSRLNVWSTAYCTSPERSPDITRSKKCKHYAQIHCSQ